jgi:protein ImuB
MNRRILCLVFPHWPVQRLWGAHPELRAGELVVHRRDARRGDIVVDCCPRGYRAGIRPGMPLAEAHAMAHHSPPQTFSSRREASSSRREASSSRREVVGENRPGRRQFHRYDPEEDRAELQRLAEWCQQFTPVVGLDDQSPPTALLLDVTRTAGRFGGEQTLGAQILQQFVTREWVLQGGFASTLGGAWAAAHEAAPQTLLSLAGKEWEDFQAAIPVTRLRLDRLTEERLSQLGIQTFGELLMLPRDGLRLRLGAHLLQRIDQLLGRTLEPIQAYRSRDPLEIQYAFEHPTDRWEVIEQVVRQMVYSLVERLRAQGMGVLRLQWEFRLPHGKKRALEVSLFRPMAQPEYLIRLLLTRLECHKHVSLWEIQGLVLRVVLSVPLLEHRSQSLWTSRMDGANVRRGEEGETAGDLEEGAARALAQLVEQLSCRLGRESVLGVRLLADPDPEQGYRYLELAGGNPEPPRSHGQTVEKSGTRELPLWLLPTPLAIQVQRDLKQGHLLTMESPMAAPRLCQIHAWNGPERIQGGWWRGRTIARDYYRVEDKQGGRWWIFRELMSSKWFLHGVYG